MHPSGKPLHLDHILPQNPSERLTSRWLCWITHFSLQPQDTLANETAKLPIEAVTPEARAISIYFKIQDPYLWSLAGCLWWRYLTGLEWPVVLSSLVCIGRKEQGCESWKLRCWTHQQCFLLPSEYFRNCHLMPMLNCLKMYIKMPAHPLYQSLTLTFYTLLKASAYLHSRVCCCLACREARIFLQHRECPASLWKLVCRKEETYFLNVVNMQTLRSLTCQAAGQFIRWELHWPVTALNTTRPPEHSPILTWCLEPTQTAIHRVT